MTTLNVEKKNNFNQRKKINNEKVRVKICDSWGEGVTN